MFLYQSVHPSCPWKSVFSLAPCKTAQEELQDLCRKAANGEFPFMKHPQHLSYYIKGFHLCFRLLMSWNFLGRTQLRSDLCWKNCPNGWVASRIVHFWPMDSHSRYDGLPVPVTNFDPNAMSYDPNAVSFDPNAMSFDPTATMFDPSAKVSWRREF